MKFRQPAFRNDLYNRARQLQKPAETNGKPSPDQRMLALSVGALGIVYGDIGTSPLYAFRESFLGLAHLSASPVNVLGVLSLIFWSLIIVITVKYLMIVMRADNKGEGGLIALVALMHPRTAKPHTFRGGLVLMGLFGAALLYGDGTITPAISVLSAVEGLKVATSAFDHFVIPITIAILVGLFFVQHRGTHAIGSVFGPFMLFWFLLLGVLGIGGIIRAPGVLVAVSPHYAFDFFAANGMTGFLVLGTVFLVVTGGETLYADMGHFGRQPIRLAWFRLVLPALLLNYFGQGALVLSSPQEISQPFYHLAPAWALYPLVFMATIATVIASQAVISGVFSLTRQAMQLGQLPRMHVVQTHGQEFGQIYIPVVNWGLMLATVGLVLGFKSSGNLASAYGVAIATDMVITTILTLTIARRWGWNPALLFMIATAFLFVDLAFFGANLLKIWDGGWYPLLVGGCIFTIMTTWNQGRLLLSRRLGSDPPKISEFLKSLKTQEVVRTSGAAMFMTSNATKIPAMLAHHVEHNRALQETVILCSVDVIDAPHVPAAERLEIVRQGDGFYSIFVRYGFMQVVNVPMVLRLCKKLGVPVDIETTTFYLGRETLIPSDAYPGMMLWRDYLFAFLSRNAARATQFYNIPPDQVVELGLQVEI
jgi:KUP system potassium uptake protein